MLLKKAKSCSFSVHFILLSNVHFHMMIPFAASYRHSVRHSYQAWRNVARNLRDTKSDWKTICNRQTYTCEKCVMVHEVC